MALGRFCSMSVLAGCWLVASVSTGFSAKDSAVTTSGLPVPRYVSLKSDHVNVRAGPTKDNDVAWIYTRSGLPVEITTGRRLSQGWPEGTDDVVVMLDGVEAFRSVADRDAHIYWGAYLGTDLEVTLSGRLGDVAETISETRSHAREKHGWIMDTYLIRRTRAPETGGET